MVPPATALCMEICHPTVTPSVETRPTSMATTSAAMPFGACST